jgi:alpha-1,6-mannosyltransferase
VADRALVWRTSPTARLMVPGGLSLLLYAVTLVRHDFYRGGMLVFLPLCGGAFVLYAWAIRLVIRCRPQPQPSLPLIFGFAAAFNGLLVLNQPTLSSDMYRYIWDGRVQAAGINPYRYASNAGALAYLRDDRIWAKMNRPSAHTIYPPGAQMIFALAWRLFPDSVIGFKVIMVLAFFWGGLLLVMLLRTLGENPAQVLTFLWSPLLIFEIAQAGHVDALYVPIVIAALLLRARAPAERVSWRHEALLGILLGMGTLLKLYPAFLAASLWSVRDALGRRRWRLALPIALVATVAVGYALYLEPGVNVLGFFSQYQREFFNIAPLPMGIIHLGWLINIPWYIPVNTLMPTLIVLVSLYFWLFPARTAREAILRCAWPVGIYLIINQNVFPWYVIFMLPLVAIELRSWRISYALAWWVFSGLIALSYTFFIAGKQVEWTIWVQYYPFYLLLVLTFVIQKYEARHRRAISA